LRGKRIKRGEIIIAQHWRFKGGEQIQVKRKKGHGKAIHSLNGKGGGGVTASRRKSFKTRVGCQQT